MVKLADLLKLLACNVVVLVLILISFVFKYFDFKLNIGQINISFSIFNRAKMPVIFNILKFQSSSSATGLRPEGYVGHECEGSSVVRSCVARVLRSSEHSQHTHSLLQPRLCPTQGFALCGELRSPEPLTAVSVWASPSRGFASQ